MKVFNQIKKPFKYLFGKPKIKIGDRLKYYNYKCEGVYFSWKDGLWFIKIGNDVSISHGLEKWCINNEKQLQKKCINQIPFDQTLKSQQKKESRQV